MADLKSELLRRLDEKSERMLEIRHYLHENPEISWQEEKTADYIAEFYQDLDCEVTRNVGDGYGIVVDIDSGRAGRALALRADFDGLAIQEETDVPYKSQVDGAMHACGHDAHTAYMLVLAETLIELKDEWTGKIRIIHQNAEEVTPGGAIGMVEAGAVEGVDAIFGIHVMANQKLGDVVYCPGNSQTGRGNFELKIIGRGGHASSPHESKDAIVAGAYFVTQLQTVVSRALSPFEIASVSVGNFDGRGPMNAINGEVNIGADLRAMSSETQATVEAAIKNLLEGMKASFGVDYEVKFTYDYPVLYNDPDLAAFFEKSMNNSDIPEMKHFGQCPPQAPSEDFAHFANEVPGLFFYVGCTPENREMTSHHNPKFYCDDASVLISAKTMGAFALDYLAS